MTQEEVQDAALSVFEIYLFTKHRSGRLQMQFKIGALKNFATFTRKYLCWSLFLIKFQV